MNELKIGRMDNNVDTFFTSSPTLISGIVHAFRWVDAAVTLSYFIRFARTCR